MWGDKSGYDNLVSCVVVESQRAAQEQWRGGMVGDAVSC